jgi:hypothetical protein
MGAWAVWTWSQDQEKNREKERARMAALYVNPFLSACEDLQSRIYNILELGGLSALRKQALAGTHAEETLYLVVRFFGWLTTVSRYGPYTQNPVVIRFAEGVRGAFATTDPEHPASPFNFSHTEQKALGKMVMSRIRGEHGIELDTISYYEFKERLALPPLSDSKSVQESLEALRNAEETGNLIGRERLLEAQNHLVDLLSYLEGKEGFSLFPGVRKKCAGPEAQRSAPLPLKEVSARSPA